MNFFLGSEVFQKGVKNFVKRFKFGVSTVKSAWNAFTEVVNDEKAKIGSSDVLTDKFTINEIMDTWTNQNGLPLISVTRNDDSSVTVEQVLKFSPNIQLFVDENNLHIEGNLRVAESLWSWGKKTFLCRFS